MKASYGGSAMWRGIGLPRECAGSRSMGRPRKSWIHTVKECLKKRGLDARQARRMVQDRSKWWGFVRVECMDEPLTLTRCHICGLLQLYEGWKSIFGQAYNLKEIKGKFSAFLLFLKVCFSHGIKRADTAGSGGGDCIIK